VTRAERAEHVLARLKDAYPGARCALIHQNPFELLVATILSAQCTDERVNMVTPGLFRRWPTPGAMAGADPGELEEAIRSTGFYRNKTKSILGASRRIAEEFGGKVPGTMEELLSLPGVARKTANVVLGTAFGRNEGVVVDTHVQRLSQRMGLTTEQDPQKIERDLMDLFPRQEWTDLGHRLIMHGRLICNARLPKCAQCVLGPDVCASFDPDPAAWRSGKAERAGKPGRPAPGKKAKAGKKKAKAKTAASSKAGKKAAKKTGKKAGKKAKKSARKKAAKTARKKTANKTGKRAAKRARK
jgi:endonuclease-3